MAVILPYAVTVCGFAELADYCSAGVSHVLSILDPGSPIPEELALFSEHRRLELRFHDIVADQPGMQPPGPEHICRLQALGRDLTAARSADRHLLIHCHAGFSRSPAVVALLLAQAQPSLAAERLAVEVLRIRPNAWPNLRIMELGDSVLHRRGELVEAASWIYRYRLEHEPGLADMIAENGRAREVQAGRRLEGSADFRQRLGHFRRELRTYGVGL
ncbi:MAG: protein-tyrosine-phosphatase [Alphaproteobacteria bacterium]|nr:protein-tyrosine-phosphatase [Alphaproteobacteria bacterium]